MRLRDAVRVGASNSNTSKSSTIRTNSCVEDEEEEEEVGEEEGQGRPEATHDSNSVQVR